MSRNQIRRPKLSPQTSFDDTDCAILHVDMDAFYVSVSRLERPELNGQPVIVGGGAGRGVVLAASYEARQLGVHSAMPMGRVARIAPQAVVIPPDFQRYSQVSASVMSLLRSLTPQLEVLGIDEAFLDVSGAQRRLGGAGAIGRTIRSRVFDEQGVTCSVGIASSKFVAKLASTLCKPDGLLVVPPNEVVGFLHPLPISTLWGVGEKTEESLQRLGLQTVADVAATDPAVLQRILGPAAGAHLADLAWGRDSREVKTHGPDRSISAEETFATDVEDPEVVLCEVLRLSDKVAARLRSQEYVGKTVTLKVRFANFSTITRSKTLRTPTDVGKDIYGQVKRMYTALGLQRSRIRLVGVRVSSLSDTDVTPQQMAIDELGPGWRDAEQAIDRISAKFGKGAVQPARLFPATSLDDSKPQ
jgi:DNA polymerase-4